MKTILIPLLLISGNLLAADTDPGAALRATCAARATETPVVKGSDGWLFLPAELRHVSVGKFWGPEAAAVSKATRPEDADPLPAILDFKQQLASAGIDLIMMPVPAKAFVYPEALSGKPATGPAPERMDTFHQQFYEELRKNGITVVDLLPKMLAARNGAEGRMDCQQDSHWSGMATVLAAREIAALLKDKPWVQSATKTPVKATTKEVEIKGDLAGMMTDAPPTPEKLKLRFIGTADSGGETPVETSAASPIVLLGDSHDLVFHDGGDMLAVGAGLADQLVCELGIPVDLIAVRGSGATPARINLMRKAHANPNYLSGKKVVVWCFSVREFTESTGWKKVPVVATK